MYIIQNTFKFFHAIVLTLITYTSLVLRVSIGATDFFFQLTLTLNYSRQNINQHYLRFFAISHTANHENWSPTRPSEMNDCLGSLDPEGLLLELTSIFVRDPPNSSRSLPNVNFLRSINSFLCLFVYQPLNRQ